MTELTVELVLCKCGSNKIKFVEQSYMLDGMKCMDCGHTGPPLFDGEWLWALKAWNEMRRREIRES